MVCTDIDYQTRSIRRRTIFQKCARELATLKGRAWDRLKAIAMESPDMVYQCDVQGASYCADSENVSGNASQRVCVYVVTANCRQLINK